MRTTVGIAVWLVVLGTCGAIARAEEEKQEKEGIRIVEGELLDEESDPTPIEESGPFEPIGPDPIAKMFIHVSYTKSHDFKLAEAKVKREIEAYLAGEKVHSVYGVELDLGGLEAIKDARQKGNQNAEKWEVERLIEAVLWTQRVHWVRKQINLFVAKNINSKILVVVSGHDFDGSLTNLVEYHQWAFAKDSRKTIIPKVHLSWDGVSDLLKAEAPQHVSFMSPGSKGVVLARRNGSKFHSLAAISLLAPFSETEVDQRWMLLASDLPKPPSADYASTVYFAVDGDLAVTTHRQYQRTYAKWKERLPGLGVIDDPNRPAEAFARLYQAH